MTQVNTGRFPWRISFWWLFWSVIVALLPIWFQILMSPIFFKPLVLSDLANKGQFAIYAATISASTIYLLYKGEGSRKMKGWRLFSAACYLLLLLPSLLFVVVTTCTHGQIPINLLYVRRLTVLLFLGAVGIGFLLTGLDHKSIIPEIESRRKTDAKKIEEQFQRTGGVQ